MKRLPLLLALLALVAGCEEQATDLSAGQEYAHLTGQVRYAEDLSPAVGVFLRTMTHLETTYSDSLGFYDLAVAMPKNGAQESVTLEFSKVGFSNAYISTLIEPGATTPLPTVTLDRSLDSTITDTTGSGDPEMIILISLEPETLSVIGMSGPTATHIVCEVRDNNGRPVDSLHNAQVAFNLEVDPGGGAYLYPPTGVTDSDGRVSTTFYSGTMSGYGVISAQLMGYNQATIVCPDIIIYQTGEPASITLQSLQYDSIAVHGAGAIEATTLVFQVRDAWGSPISSMSPAEVNFAILGGPDGGEYLYPTSGTTNELGQVSTSLNSGMVSGAVQVQAILSGDSSIACAPVSVTIHSGLPDAAHFAVVPRYVNCPGFNYYGVVDSISAMVGDMYSNPVPLGTAVYFSTTSGIIEGSGTTCASGFATVRLFSGPPSPPASYPFGTIIAQTVGSGGQILETQTQVLFSGVTQIYDVNPTGFTVGNGGSQNFTFRVSDQNGYPLAYGTNITVETSAGALIGLTNIWLPDTQSQAWTYFGFALIDDDAAESDPPVNASVAIVVNSPNGNLSTIITGTLD
ncbi:MAG: hypothetical protein C4534_00485 [Gaiellales bacterium]|nr:MAG: hypothetical protein C4534_00485 [Gaiellales bacterium]